MWETWVGKIPWRWESLPTPVFWPGELHGLYSPWGHRESVTAEREREDRFWPPFFLLLEAEYSPPSKKSLDTETAKLRQISPAFPSRDLSPVFSIIL